MSLGYAQDPSGLCNERREFPRRRRVVIAARDAVEREWLALGTVQLPAVAGGANSGRSASAAWSRKQHEMPIGEQPPPSIPIAATRL